MFCVSRLGLLTLVVAMAVAPRAARGDSGLDDPIATGIPQGPIRIALEPVATGLTAPNWGMFAPGVAANVLFVTDQNGIVWRINLRTGSKRIFLDVRERLVPLGAVGQFDERGLLGIAFHPDYATNGLLYTYTSEPANGPADFSTLPEGTAPDHHNVIIEWRVPEPTRRTAVVDPTSAREILRMAQPQFNHNAGAITFGPDRMLYIVIGDGGGADDQDGQIFQGEPMVGHGKIGNGQDPSTVLGAVLRIDPTGTNAVNGQYGIPTDNPFFVAQDSRPVGGQPGCGDGLCDEIFAYGFRNPFRFSFDMPTGLLFVGDVGQNDIEEVDVIVAGGNYGWRLKEGTFFFHPNGTQEIEGAGFVIKNAPDVPPGLIDPIAQYDHDEGVAVVGGFVYRGSALPALQGRYIFGDFTRPPFDPLDLVCNGRLFFLEQEIPRTPLTEFLVRINLLMNTIVEFPLAGREALGLCLLGFGQDANGEIYVLANETGTPFGNTGVVLQMRQP